MISISEASKWRNVLKKQQTLSEINLLGGGIYVLSMTCRCYYASRKSEIGHLTHVNRLFFPL